MFMQNNHIWDFNTIRKGQIIVNYLFCEVMPPFYLFIFSLTKISQKLSRFIISNSEYLLIYEIAKNF
jgi:hypothetical protein